MTPRCDRCNDSGTVALDVRNWRYVAPGPVPEDARGVCEYACRECPPAEEPEVCDDEEMAA